METPSRGTLTSDPGVRKGDRSNVLSAVFVLTVLSLGMAAQAQTYLNHDVAWVLYSSRKMLEGAEFGSEIVAANPPLIWWISLIPNILSRATDLSVIDVFRALVFVGLAASIYGFRKFAFAKGPLAASQVAFLICLAWLISFAPHRDFGQREHLTILLVLPYLGAIIGRLENRWPRRWQGLLIGVAAGIAIALKPYFIFVPLLVEGLFLLRSRNFASLMRPEAVGAVVAAISYAIALPLFASGWLFSAAPDIHRVYWAFEQPLPLLSLGFVLSLPFALFIWVTVTGRSENGLVFGMGALGFLIAALIQGKLYSYHLYPAYALLVLAGLFGVFCSGRKVSRIAIALSMAVMLNSIFVAQASIWNRTSFGEVGNGIEDLSDFVNRAVPKDGTFISISTHPYPGFPTALYADREWGSATNSRIYLPAIVKLRTGNTMESPELRRFAEAKAHEALLRDLRLKPHLILVDENEIRHAIGAISFDFMAFYQEDPKIRALMGAYRRLENAPKGFAAYQVDATEKQKAKRP